MNTSTLLKKLARMVKAYEKLAEVDSKELHPVEANLLDALEHYVIPLFSQVIEVTDDVFAEHRKFCKVRRDLSELPEEKSKRKSKTPENNLDEALALGTGMAVGGVFNYLQEGEEGTEKSETEITCISDEELDALEQALEDDLGENIPTDDMEEFAEELEEELEDEELEELQEELEEYVDEESQADEQFEDYQTAEYVEDDIFGEFFG